MRTQVNRTAQFGELVAAGIRRGRLLQQGSAGGVTSGSRAVSLMLRHTRGRASCQLQPSTGIQTTDLCQST